MRYIYYIIIILVISTIGAAWGVFSDTKVKLSKPEIVINNKIITEVEFDHLMKSKPSYETDQGYIDSIIIKELLIQEAIKQEINKDESFRASVEDFYEQSLVKILMDGQFKKYEPSATPNEIEKYIALAGKKIFISKLIYAKREDIKEGTSKGIKSFESNFLDLSDALKFVIFNLKPGESSKGAKSVEGFVVYNFIKAEDIKNKTAVDQMKGEQISAFIKNGKKEALLAQWIDGLKAKAEIWRDR
jgi:hypothetical protein